MDRRPGEPPRMDPRQQQTRLEDGQKQWQQWDQVPPTERLFAGPAPYADSARSAPPPGFQVPPLSGPGADQRHQQAPPSSSSPRWGGSPEQSSPVNHHGGGGAPREGRRVDPRTKYSHLKIKPKGSSSPSQSILKRPHPDSDSSSPSSFKIPRLLQDPAALDRPMDPLDLFKGSAETGYEDSSTPAPFGIFKTNFFSRSQPAPPDEGAGPAAKRAFGEITLEGTSSRDRQGYPACGAEDQKRETKGASDTDAQVGSGNEPSSKVSPEEKSPEPPSVPSYLAQLDVGLGSDLKIDSAFGSLADDGKSSKEGKKEGEESSLARKLPSMFGLGF